MRWRVFFLFAVVFALVSWVSGQGTAWAGSGANSAPQAQVRRLALVIGANNGGSQRVELRHAVSDAKTFGSVLSQLGGVASSDLMVVEEPSVAGLDKALAGFAAKVGRANGSAERVEVVLYYSGHSDRKGLLLAGKRYSYAKLRGRLDKLGADVRLVILDSCGSGEMTRQKGGTRRPPFLSDASSQVRGYAILTSSSADEAAQESDAIDASFFTHFLVSGLRGAADVNEDARVTLNEAYQFAFHETLARTERTRGGAQHAAYDMELSGRGDLVLTDVRQTSTTLVLDKGLSGRIYVRGDKGRLAVELQKRAGGARTLGLPAGRYEVVRRADDGSFARAVVELKAGEKTSLGSQNFEAISAEAARARGVTGGQESGRWRSDQAPSLARRFHLTEGMAEFRLGVGVSRAVHLEDSKLAGELVFRRALSDRLSYLFPLMFSGQLLAGESAQWVLSGGLSGFGYSSVGGFVTDAVVATSVQVRPTDSLALVARGGTTASHSWGDQSSRWGAGVSLNLGWTLGSRLSGGLGAAYSYAQRGRALTGPLADLDRRFLEARDVFRLGAIGGRSVGNLPLVQVRLWRGLHLYESSTVRLATDTFDAFEHSHILGLSWYYEVGDE